MIRGLLGLGLVGAVAAVGVERWLASNEAADPEQSIDSLVVIDAPIEQVWEQLIDVEAQPRWMHDLKSVRLETPGPVRRGTRAIGTVRVLGVSASDPIEITAMDAPTRYTVRHDGMFKGTGDIRLAAGADGTTTIVRWTEILVPPVLPRLGGIALRFAFRPIFEADLRRLRALVEAG